MCDGEGSLIGTNVFRSVSSAIRYYKSYGFNADDVRGKIGRSEILIGRVKRVPGIFPLLDGGRWFYREDK